MAKRFGRLDFDAHAFFERHDELVFSHFEVRPGIRPIFEVRHQLSQQVEQLQCCDAKVCQRLPGGSDLIANPMLTFDRRLGSHHQMRLAMTYKQFALKLTGCLTFLLIFHFALNQTPW